MIRLFLVFLCGVLVSSCGDPGPTAEEVLKDFIEASNAEKDINTFTNSKGNTRDYLSTRRLTEKINPGSVSCVEEEEEAICECETETGKSRTFRLIKSDDEWIIDVTAPEIVMELYHLLWNSGNLADAKNYATNNDRERIEYFERLMADPDFFKKDKKVAPFNIKCKEYKKKLECTCTSAAEEIGYFIYKTSKGWKVEINRSEFLNKDSIMDYNSSGDFNLNQHDLDSLTEFSQKMLDSMLNL